jgi:transcriptional regulator GlxA family with amidase domain
LRAATNWRARFTVVDEVLLRLAVARADAGPPPEVVEAWRLLVAGSRTVGEAADEVGWSVRRLSGRFGTELGVSPKTAARLGRFERARRRLQAATDVRLAELAADCGYYDQAHLAREFRELAGVPPSRLLAEEGRFVQAPVDRPEAE